MTSTISFPQIPERRARSVKKRGILLIINHEHVARVLAVKAELGEDGRYQAVRIEEAA